MPKEYFRIREVLEEKNKNQVWLADKLGVDEVTASRWMNNHRQPSMERLAEIAKALGVKIKDLIKD